MCREKAERRCHREGFRGELPWTPSFPVTGSSTEKKQRKGND